MAQLCERHCKKEEVPESHVGNHEPWRRHDMVIRHETGDKRPKRQQEDDVVVDRGKDSDPGDYEAPRQEESANGHQDHCQPVTKRRGDGGKADVQAATQDQVVSRQEQWNQEKQDVKRKACRSHDRMRS